MVKIIFLALFYVSSAWAGSIECTGQGMVYTDSSTLSLSATVVDYEDDYPYLENLDFNAGLDLGSNDSALSPEYKDNGYLGYQLFGDHICEYEVAIPENFEKFENAVTFNITVSANCEGVTSTNEMTCTTEY